MRSYTCTEGMQLIALNVAYDQVRHTCNESRVVLVITTVAPGKSVRGLGSGVKFACTCNLQGTEVNVPEEGDDECTRDRRV